MKEYKVKKSFTAFQFGSPVQAIGIEHNALKKHKEYKCLIGKKEYVKYITYDRALEIVQKHGKENVMRTQRGKWCFILPIEELSDEPIKVD